MKKENVKKFWHEHKSTIKKAVILATVPAVAIVAYVLIDKVLNTKTNEIFKELDVVDIKWIDEA